MIDKNICIPGNVFVVNSKISKLNNGWDEKDFIGLKSFVNIKDGKKYYGSKSIEIPSGTKIEILKFKNSVIHFKMISEPDNIYSAYWAGFKVKVDKIEGQEIKEPEIIPTRYKIFYKGKAHKPKYFNDLGKVKASLLITIGYYENQWEMTRKYLERNPELYDVQIPDWCSAAAETFDREDCKYLEIMSYINGDKKNPIKIDFDILKYYDDSMRLINVTAQFGHAAREVFKNVMDTKEYSYMLVYYPNDYRDPNNFETRYDSRRCTLDFSELKEDQRIKDILKNSGVKGTKKSTKFGKTAIAFKTLDELKQVMLRLEPNEYFILDCDGDQLVEKNTRFVKLIMLQEANNEE